MAFVSLGIWFFYYCNALKVLGFIWSSVWSVKGKIYIWQVNLIHFRLLPFPIIWFQGWGNIGEKSGAEILYSLTQHLLEAAIEILPLSRRREERWEWRCVVWNDTGGTDLEALSRRGTTPAVSCNSKLLRLCASGWISFFFWLVMVSHKILALFFISENNFPISLALTWEPSTGPLRTV